MAKMMTQLDILAKNVMGAGARSVNAVGVGCVNPDEAKFEALYNEKVKFVPNQRGGYRANYPRPGGNQGWNRDEDWRDCDKEWRNHNATWKEREKEKDSASLDTDSGSSTTSSGSSSWATQHAKGRGIEDNSRVEVVVYRCSGGQVSSGVENTQSTNFTSLLEAAEDQNSPPSFEAPPDTTGDVPMDDVAADESEEEANEEQLDA
uniref:Integrase core domain containing protein n=1 Tax=Solanum tuberosum TaxID=4113 RepID=M1DBJ4_SOLTU